MESNQRAPGLTWTARTVPEGLVVQVSGHVDAYNETGWQQMLQETAAAAPASSLLVIDAVSMDFVSCGAVAGLAKQAAESRQHAITVRLVTREPSLARVIAACGLDDVITAHPDLDSALKDLDRP